MLGQFLRFRDQQEQIRAKLLLLLVGCLVRNPRFASLMQEKIDMKVDTSALEQEIAPHEKQLRQYHATKSKLIDEIDSLDPDDRHDIQRKADLDERPYRMYDRIEETETLLIDARARKRAIEADKVKGDNIYRILTHFDKLYDVMSESERQELMQALISEIQIHEEPLPNGQWLKSIRFRLPIIDGNAALTLDKRDGAKTVCLLYHQKKDFISVPYEPKNADDTIWKDQIKNRSL